MCPSKYLWKNDTSASSPFHIFVVLSFDIRVATSPSVQGQFAISSCSLLGADGRDARDGTTGLGHLCDRSEVGDIARVQYMCA